MFWKLNIRQWLFDRQIRAVSTELAPDLGVPADVVQRVIAQTAKDLRELAAIDEESDARPIINKAIEELTKHGGYQVHQCDEAMMERCLEGVPERDLTILRHFKQGKKHQEIAALMDTDVETVRRSLVATYSGLRMRMRDINELRPQQIRVGGSKH